MSDNAILKIGPPRAISAIFYFKNKDAKILVII